MAAYRFSPGRGDFEAGADVPDFEPSRPDVAGL
jgi:hypothetical protein